MPSVQHPQMPLSIGHELHQSEKAVQRLSFLETHTARRIRRHVTACLYWAICGTVLLALSQWARLCAEQKKFRYTAVCRRCDLSIQYRSRRANAEGNPCLARKRERRSVLGPCYVLSAPFKDRFATSKVRFDSDAPGKTLRHPSFKTGQHNRQQPSSKKALRYSKRNGAR